MAFNYNGAYPYSWNSSTPYITNGFNATATTQGTPVYNAPPPPHPPPPAVVSNAQQVFPHQSGQQQQSLPHAFMQPHPSVPVYNTTGIFGGPRFSGGTLHYGVSGQFGEQCPGGSNSQFSGNWTFPFHPHTLQPQGQPQQQPMEQLSTSLQMATSCTEPENDSKQQPAFQNTAGPSDNVQVKDQEEKDKQNANDITEKIATKLSSILANPQLLKNIADMQTQQIVNNAVNNSSDSDETDTECCQSGNTLSDVTTDSAVRKIKSGSLDSRSPLIRSSSGSSVESLPTQIQVVEQDRSTGELLVRMSPQEFDRLAQHRNNTQKDNTENIVSVNDEVISKCKGKRVRRPRTDDEKKRQCKSQHDYYAKNKSDPVFMEKNRAKTRKSREKAVNRSMLDTSVDSTLDQTRNMNLINSVKNKSLKKEIYDEMAEYLDVKPDMEVKSPVKSEYKMSPEEKIREQNRIRQLAHKVREKMPKDYKSYCLVAAHLVRNAHRYYPEEKVLSEGMQLAEDMKYQPADKKQDSNNDSDECKEVNKKLREIRTLKKQNRIREQQDMVTEIKLHRSYRDLSKVSGIPLKTVHSWCSPPKNRPHKATVLSQLKKQEFMNFLMQDTITYSHPSKKYSGKKFLMNTWDEIYKKYLQQTEYHTNGIISKTTMHNYKPKFILLSRDTPANQCLCDYCENCSLLLKALVSTGMKGIAPNKYHLIDETLCDVRIGQFGTSYEFSPKACIVRACEECGQRQLRVKLEALNTDLLQLNNRITWHKWQKVDGKSVPQKCEIKAPLRTALTEFLDIVEHLSQHLFRASWHKNIFEHMKRNMVVGNVLQVIDFAMNFNNRYQDEVQSAYWDGTQTTIHGTVNFFMCPRRGSRELVTLAMVHLTDDLKHDSFLTRAAQNMTLKYLADLGVPLDLVIQFCDNCAAQYKSRRPFAELARCAVPIIRVFFGEKHGKSHADALFGRLKAWMAYKIKARHFIVKNAHDFYKYCKEYYETPDVEDCCQHYRVKFQFIRPSDVRRSQDCDLDQAIEGTQGIYSVRNTDQPLELKVRAVPCLCPHCILDDADSECLNAEYTDPWRTVKLIPTKGASKRKYEKRQRPDAAQRRNRCTAESDDSTEKNPVDIMEANNLNDNYTDAELPEICIDFDVQEISVTEAHKIEKKKRGNSEKSVTDGVTDGVTDTRCTWTDPHDVIDTDDGAKEKDSESDIIDLCEEFSAEFLLSGENALIRKKTVSIGNILDMNVDIPELQYWLSILSALDGCSDNTAFEQMAWELKTRIPARKARVIAWCGALDELDRVAQAEIPEDRPIHLNAVKTIGDGNCLCRALSKAFYNDDAFHIEIRVRIIIEGVTNKPHYISDDCLERGASLLHSNADLPTVFASFSDYFTPGQLVTADTISYIYGRELHECTKIGTYMGLWQLAQASTVLGVPIHTIYPHRAGGLRNDFHRIFFPVDYPALQDDEPVVIMWTGIRSGSIPCHFVPLLNAQQAQASGRKRKTPALPLHDTDEWRTPVKQMKQGNLRKEPEQDSFVSTPSPTPGKKRGRPRKKKNIVCGEDATQKSNAAQLCTTSHGRIVKRPEKYEGCQPPSRVQLFQKKLDDTESTLTKDEDLAESDICLDLDTLDMEYLKNNADLPQSAIDGNTVDDEATMASITSRDENISNFGKSNTAFLHNSGSGQGVPISLDNEMLQEKTSEVVSSALPIEQVTIQNATDAFNQLQILTTDNKVSNTCIPIDPFNGDFEVIGTAQVPLEQIVQVPVNVDDNGGQPAVYFLQLKVDGKETDSSPLQGKEVITTIDLNEMPSEIEPDIKGTNSEKIDLEEDATDDIKEEIKLSEPQRTSTPEMLPSDLQNLNETILAGNIVQPQPLNDVTEHSLNAPTPVKISQEVVQVRTAHIHTASEETVENSGTDGVGPDANLTNGTEPHKGKEDLSTTETEVYSDVVRTKIHKMFSSKVKQLELVHEKDSSNPPAPEAETSKVHNKTYCRDWLKKSDLVEKGTGKIVLETSTEPDSAENVSKLCHVTSVSRNPQNYIKNKKQTNMPREGNTSTKKTVTTIKPHGVSMFYSRSYKIVEKSRELQRQKESELRSKKK